jgi:hypothetical protein
MKNSVCPECGSAHVTAKGFLMEGAVHDAHCGNCGWRGKDTELLVIPDGMVERELSRTGDVMTPDTGVTIVAKMSEDLLTRLARNAGKEIGLSLVQAGFVGLKDSKHMGRLIRAACLGAVGGVMGEMEGIQQEEQSGTPKTTT